MNRGENSLVGGLISALTLVALNYLVGIATSRSKRLEAFIDWRPELLLHNGSLYPHVLMRAQLARHEHDTAIRAADCASIKDVHVASLEYNETNLSPSCRNTPEVEVSPSALKPSEADCHVHRQQQRVSDVRTSEGWNGVR